MSYKRIAEIESEMKKLEKEHKALIEKYKNLTPEQKFATVLHDTLCTSNHMDGCGWEYEKWENVQQSYAKKRYLKMARDLTERGFNEDQALDFISVIKRF